MDRDLVVSVAGHVALFVVGVLLAIGGTFLIPLRWPGSVEGLCVVIAVVGNVALGWLGAVGMRSGVAGALGGIGWLVTVLVLGNPRREGDVLIAASVRGDPALGTVGTLFFLVGSLAAVVGVVLGARKVAAGRRSGEVLHPSG